MAKLWIYLARRDRKDIKVITTLEGPDCLPNRLDIKKLKLPAPIHESIEKTIHDNRMLWEPWIQSADSIHDLIKSLQSRGYMMSRKLNPLINLTRLETEHNISWRREVNKKNIKNL